MDRPTFLKLFDGVGHEMADASAHYARQHKGKV